MLCHFFYGSKSLLKEFARNDASSSEHADIDTGYVVTRKGFKKRVDKLDLSFMNYQDAFKSKSTMEVRLSANHITNDKYLHVLQGDTEGW